ncbi:hypothetical protein GSI_04162 [Ganoderma sinense ZZ0214-1]|uniref:Uncharacterized protein n=1 Tax=Ganoderma sinense ZZ0214-1 TaxID=1077348 RepID=A0A2G8SIE2_9APHY|nr:hypothetical protein GSI_04162 [Ganoderma sinense ZZ0214-1]
MSDSNANPSDRGSAQRDKSNAPTSTTGQTGKSGRTASPADKNATYRQLLKDLRDDVRALGVTKSEALKEFEDTRRFTQELVEETQSFAQEMKSSMQGMREDMAALTKTVGKSQVKSLAALKPAVGKAVDGDAHAITWTTEDSTRNTKHVLEDMSDTLSRIEADIA